MDAHNHAVGTCPHACPTLLWRAEDRPTLHVAQEPMQYASGSMHTAVNEVRALFMGCMRTCGSTLQKQCLHPHMPYVCCNARSLNVNT
eukprot:21497-Chlamydomonas_euryale.AAC.2